MKIRNRSRRALETIAPLGEHAQHSPHSRALIDLLAGRNATKLSALLDELRRDPRFPPAAHPLAEILQQPIDLGDVHISMQR